MPPRTRRARHHDTTWRPATATIGNDHWQRQADAAAWSAVSGLPPALYLGGIEPIPIPPTLRDQLREAGKALAAEPAAHRADALLRLAHRAVYGTEPTEPPLESPQKPVDGVSGEWWDDIPAEPEKPLAVPSSPATLVQHAADALAALHASEWTPEDDGEQPRKDPEEWWTV